MKQLDVPELLSLPKRMSVWEIRGCIHN